MSSLNVCCLTAMLCGVFATVTPGHADTPATWPRFRGPDGSGISENSSLSLEFGPETNVLWKTGMPTGHSSPVVWGSRVFLTGCTDETLETLCVDLSDGSILWRRSAPLRGKTVPKVRNVNSKASPSAAVDGDSVYVYFDAFGMIAYDFDGNEKWRKPLPKAKQPWGVGTSPVVSKNRVLLNLDQDIDSFLLAVDAKTGKTVWRTERPEFRRGWSTPLVVNDRIIVAGSLRMIAYDFDSGKELWSVHGLPYQVSPSPVYANDTIYMAAWDLGGVGPNFDDYLERYDADKSDTISVKEHNFRWDFPKFDRDKDKQITRAEFEDLVRVFNESKNSLMAVRLGGSGNVTESHVKWETSASLPHVPSVLAYRGLIYTVRNGGVLSCYDAETGSQHYRVRLPAGGDYFASPVAAAGNLFFTSKKGVVCVVRAGSEYELLHKNPMDAEIMATPAIVGDTMLLRTREHLYAIGGQ